MRRRLLLIAYRFDPDFSMESRLAWQRARTAAEEYDVTVLCALASDAGARHCPEGVEILQVPVSRGEQFACRWPGGGYVANRRWQHRAAQVAEQRHRSRPFDLIHHVSYCGYRQPSECSRLPAPYIWGPLGGTHSFPIRFLTAIDPVGAMKELVRNAANWLQLRFSPRVRRAMRRSTAVLAASSQTGRELVAAGHHVSGILLETGVDGIRKAPRPQRDPEQPFRLLWAGRACSWKGLPLLLRALARVPRDKDVILRVMADGPRLSAWKRLANRLDLAGRVEWVGWPGCEGRLPQYEWSDAFAFTSLRDTSGTGLLESLAAGAPVIGFDHQGAADVLDETCGVKIPVAAPAAAIEAFREAIVALVDDGERLARLSAGAIARAATYDWDCQGRSLREIYAAALAAPRSAQSELSTKAAISAPLKQTSRSSLVAGR